MTQNNERDALKNIIDAWECLSEGSYTPSTIQMWLIANMKPAINSARKVIESISQNEQQEAVAYTDGEGDFITKEMYDEYLKLGFYTECIVPLYTSPKQIPDGWKPIETAPKDGTQVLINCTGGRISTAFFNVEPFIGEGWHVVVPCMGGIGSGTDTYIHFPEDMPTHWMPLQEAPTTSLTSETNTEVGK